MPRTPDRFPGVREDEGVRIVPDSAAPSVNGEITYVSGVGFQFYEEGVVKTLAGIDHEIVDSLVHDLAEDLYMEVTRDGNNRASTITFWTDSGKTLKVRETVLSRDINNRVYQTEDRQYDSSGGVVHRVITVLTRTSGRISSADLDEV